MPTPTSPATGYVVDDVTDAEVSTGQTVTIGDEQSVTCTVTNTWQNSTLTLRKQVLVPFGANPGAGRIHPDRHEPRSRHHLGRHGRRLGHPGVGSRRIELDSG